MGPVEPEGIDVTTAPHPPTEDPVVAPGYEVHAIRFCHRAARRQDHFYEPVDDPDAPMPIDYYLWVARSPDRIVVMDAGYTPEVSARRGAHDGRTYLNRPLDTLAQLGVAADDVDTVTLSHLHYDHTGLVPAFPQARVVVQERELGFWCGPDARRAHFARLCEPDDVAGLVRRNLAGGVAMVDGDAEVAPGITVHRVGGHTPGTQVVRIATASGFVVVASDASHFYANVEQRRPYALVHTLPQMYDAFDRLEELATRPDLVVPGHDPAVIDRFPPSRPDLAGLAARIA